MNQHLIKMIETRIKSRGIKGQRLLNAMLLVDRADFVPENLKDCAYDDRPLPIGHSQTISQPYIVALMTELCGLTGIGKARFDVILITAAPAEIPLSLFDQLAEGGILVSPEGGFIQTLIKAVKQNEKIKKETVTYVRFVPLLEGVE